MLKYLVKNQSSLDLERLLIDNGVDFSTSSDGEWINVACPFCDDSKKHLGYSLTKGNWTCFRCGKHRDYETIAGLLNQTLVESRRTCEKYRKAEGVREGIQTSSRPITTRNSGCLEVKLPYGTAKMTERHRNYLKSRDFDPDQLEREWSLLGTGSLGPFANRIIIPIYQAGELVCYQGRDITGKSKTRYKSCPDDLAKISIKNLIYGIDKVEGDRIVITEGATKVWRIGSPAVATFGAIVTDAQILILKKFQKRIVLFDGDNTGRERAANLASRLGMFSGKTEVFELPDGMSPDDVACAVNGVRKMCLED